MRQPHDKKRINDRDNQSRKTYRGDGGSNDITNQKYRLNLTKASRNTLESEDDVKTTTKKNAIVDDATIPVKRSNNRIRRSSIWLKR